MSRRKRRQRSRILDEEDERMQIFKEEIEILGEEDLEKEETIPNSESKEGRDKKRKKND